MYGEALVDFAQKAVASRKPVARGECWDVAAEGLDSIATGRQDLPKPFPSIGRTHGHLIYYGNAEGGQDRGEWRGGDPYVRGGDIVEWRSVTIREVGMQAGAFMKLGAPEVRQEVLYNIQQDLLTLSLVDSTPQSSSQQVHPSQLHPTANLIPSLLSNLSLSSSNPKELYLSRGLMTCQP